MYNNAHRGCANEDVIGDAMCRQSPAKSTRRAVFEGQRFEQRKVSAAHEHVGARASPSYAREECKHTTLVGPWRGGFGDTRARQPHAMAPVGPRSGRRLWGVSIASDCSTRTKAHASDTCVGLRTIKYGWMDASTPCKVLFNACQFIYMYFCIIAFNCFPGNKCCVPCRLSRESFHRVKEPQQLC